MAEILLDVSDLEPCEPLERTLTAVTNLEPGNWIRVLLCREPFPLYELLEKQGMRWKTQPGLNSAYETLIWHSDDSVTENAIQQLNDN